MESWEFGRVVRRWRDRVTPETVGVPVGRRRRASGLRREELAGLAGISADYLTRLEQGRATAPSAQVVEATWSPALGRRRPPSLPDPAKRKVVDHPAAGRITPDCDTLVVAVDDLRIMVYTAERLALALVLGTQTLAEPAP